MLDFTTLYERHAGDVLRFALYLTGNRAEAEDIVSETFTRVWTARERVELNTVKGYLFTIARNLHLHERRRKLRQGEFRDEPADGGPGPEAAVCERDELDAVLAALEDFSEVDRTALLLRAREGLPYEEIAGVLGLSLAAVKVKIHRARRKLAERFRQPEERR